MAQLRHYTIFVDHIKGMQETADIDLDHAAVQYHHQFANMTRILATAEPTDDFRTALATSTSMMNEVNKRALSAGTFSRPIWRGPALYF